MDYRIFPIRRPKHFEEGEAAFERAIALDRNRAQTRIPAMEPHRLRLSLHGRPATSSFAGRLPVEPFLPEQRREGPESGATSSPERVPATFGIHPEQTANAYLKISSSKTKALIRLRFSVAYV
jgi:hypothetical protein